MEPVLMFQRVLSQIFHETDFKSLKIAYRVFWGNKKASTND